MDMDRKTVYQVAREREELEQSFSLVFKEYSSRGYVTGHYKSEMRLSVFNAVPATTTFIAKQGDDVVATVTLIVDSPMGLPMDKIYKPEVDRLRQAGRRVAEVVQLAVDSRLFPKDWFSMFNAPKLFFIFRLFKIVLDYAQYQQEIDDLCIAINPKHRYLYEFLEFEELGELREYGSMNCAPAIAKRLDIAASESKARLRKGIHKLFFGKRTDEQAFRGKFAFTDEDLKYFFVEQSDIFEKATQDQLDHLRECYTAAPSGELSRYGAPRIREQAHVTTPREIILS